MKVVNLNMKLTSIFFFTFFAVIGPLVFSLINDIDSETQERHDLLKSTFEKYLSFNPVEIEFSSSISMDRPLNISREKAVEDVEFFFNSLRNQYAAYEIFGGLKTFDEIKVKVMNDLGSDTIQVEHLSKAILGNLKVINDAHFNFDGHTLAKRKAFYTSSEYLFSKDDKMFYLRDVLINEIPTNLETALYPVLDSEGSEKYQFGIMKTIDGSVTFVDFTYSLSPIDITYEKARVFLFHYNVEVPYELPIYNEKNVDGIKVIQINGFNPQNIEEESMLSNFANSFDGVTENMPVVIDLRFNSGGNSSYVDAWAMNTFGISTILGNYFTAYLTDKGWSESSFISQPPIKNDIPIYVLTSVITASSAEGFTKFLRNVENVTFIGENTMGCQLVGNIKSLVLPHSMINVSFGSALFMEEDLIPIEGIGFLPDFWMDPMLAFDSAMSYILRKHF